jgi:hypothetical protein
MEASLMLSFDAIKDRKTFQLGKVVVNFVQTKNSFAICEGIDFVEFLSRGSEGINNLKG